MELNLNYEFKEPKLLEQALTHRSLSKNNYERLEFLGDSILGAVIASVLFNKNKNDQEGNLTRVKSAIVNEKTLSEIAISINLHKYIKVSKSAEKELVYIRPSVLCDVLEAVIGAIYTDGGYEAAETFILDTLGSTINNPTSFRDFKSELQPIVQRKFKCEPLYKTAFTSGPEHSKIFKVQVYAMGHFLGEDEGMSRKEAEQNAAKQVLFAMI